MSPNTFLEEAVLFLTWHVPHGLGPELILQKPSWRLPISSHLVFTLIIVPMTLWKGLDAPICCLPDRRENLQVPLQVQENRLQTNHQTTVGGPREDCRKDTARTTSYKQVGEFLTREIKKISLCTSAKCRFVCFAHVRQ